MCEVKGSVTSEVSCLCLIKPDLKLLQLELGLKCNRFNGMTKLIFSAHE